MTTAISVMYGSEKVKGHLSFNNLLEAFPVSTGKHVNQSTMRGGDNGDVYHQLLEERT